MEKISYTPNYDSNMGTTKNTVYRTVIPEGRRKFENIKLELPFPIQRTAESTRHQMTQDPVPAGTRSFFCNNGSN